MHEYVHVNEKWFNSAGVSKSFYKARGEKAPKRSSESRRYIPKTIFLAAAVRTRYDMHEKASFGGKFGIW